MSSNARPGDPEDALPLALALLAGGMTKTQLGREIGYDRASVSRWINEPGYNGAYVAAAVLARFSRLTCPYLKTEIAPAQCAALATRACPTCNAREVRHWKACQSCAHKPSTGERP